MKYLPSADRVIVMDKNGTILQRGTYQELHLDDGYVKGLALGQEDGPNSKGEEDETTHQEPTATSKSRGPPQSENAEQALIRQTGDRSLYKFYLQSVGAWLFAGWLILAAIYIFSGKLPRKCTVPVITSGVVLYLRQS